MTIFKKLSIYVAAVAALVLPQIRAGTFSSDFTAGTPPDGMTLNGSTVIENGILKITKAINSQGGSAVISDVDSGAPVYGFDLTANVRLGGGTSTPADGFSINFDPTAGPTTQTGEEGTAGGITFSFDIFDNGNENPPAPSIDVKVGGTVVATHHMTIADFDTGTDFVPLHITVGADGATSLAYKGNIIFTNLYFAGYAPIAGGSFVIGGRTGGLNENQWFDDLNITTFTQPKVGVAVQPKSETVLVGSNTTISPTLNNTDGATFQWFKNGQPIQGANSADLTLTGVTAADNGNKYKLTITGPNNTVTTDEVTLTVRDIPLPATPQLSFNFDDGTAPPDTSLVGNPDTTSAGYITATGGVNDSGVLHITDAVNGVAGAFIINDPAAGQPVYGFTASFDMLVGGGTVPPADGFSFNFASDIPDDPTTGQSTGAEDGVGTGLTVGFDIFDNGGGEAPSIDVRLGGQLLAQVKVPLSFIDTGTDFAPVVIRLEDDGTLDVAYKGVVVYDNFPVPGLSSITGGRFAFVGRTGGLNENQWVDNLDITTDTTPGTLRITSPPNSQTVLAGKPATFSVGVNDPTGVSYQWSRNGTPIQGATSSSYTLNQAAVGDNGATFTVTATKGTATATSNSVTLTVVDLAPPANPAANFTFDDGQVPVGTTLTGNDTTIAGYVTTTGGVNDSGVLHLTDAANSANGGFVIDPLLGGAEVSSFTIAFDARIGGGTPTPADGFSVNFAPDLPTTVGNAEDGAGSGLTVGFDIFDNGNETPPAPSIDVKWNGALVASVHVPRPGLETGDAFKTVIIHVSDAGKLELAYGDTVYFNALQLPNYTFISNGKVGFYGRTGGLNENQWFDNILIGLNKSTVFRISQEPADALVIDGSTATFNVVVSDPAGATYQWSRNGQPIQGATGPSYTTPALTVADSGTTYRVVATAATGGRTATSRDALVTVVPPLSISNPKVSFDFEDGAVPNGTELNAGTGGGGYIDAGVVHLTDAANGQGGTFVVNDLDNGQAVNAFTAHFKVRVGGGTTPPADGFSFVWVNDLPAGVVFGEDGSGTGLVISFDIFDNGNETPPAPSIDARFNGTTAATVHLPYQQMETGDNFGDVFIRLESDGTLDLQYNGMAIFNNVQLPGFTPLRGAAFAIGARTGGYNENQWIDDVQIATSVIVGGAHLTITKQADGKLKIEWDGAGTLQSAADVTGQWTPVTGATSGVLVSPSANHQFFRVVQ